MTTTTAFDALSTLCTLAALTGFTKETTVSVYSGKDGKCCCGCAGTHRYNSRLVATASANRGYEVSADEISDAQVTRVLRTIIEGDADGLEFGDRYVSRVVNGRVFVAYLAD